MNKKSRKPIVFICLLILTIPICFYVLLLFLIGDDHYTIKTEFGDEINVTFDGQKSESSIRFPDSDLSAVYGGRISEKDITGVTHTSSLTIYNIKGSYFFNDGSGFKEFTYESVNSVPDVAEMVKSRLLTSYDKYVNNIDYFFKNSKYKAEIEHMIENIQKDKYEELSQYGLTEDVINDRCTLTNIKYEISHPRNNI
ncbi:MAG: hypothetical protein IJM32_10075 [Ruminococcus sp.]|nr:hypothetical protein [Ruminococcus sp.]